MCTGGFQEEPPALRIAESLREKATRNREFSASLADDECRLDGPPTRSTPGIVDRGES